VLKWLRRKTASRAVPSYPTFDGRRIIPVPGGRRVHIVGESRHQRELEEIAGPKTEEGVRLKVTALIVPEPDNPSDPRALAVYVEHKHAGYFSREDAIAYHALSQQLEAKSAAARCRGEIRGGWRRPRGDEGAFGVVLDLAPPARFNDPEYLEGAHDAGPP